MEDQNIKVQPHRRGWGKVIVRIALIIAGIVGALIWAAWPPREPKYEGKNLSYWLTLAISNSVSDSANSRQDAECRKAVRTMGTNAIPALLWMLRAKDSSAKEELLEFLWRHDLIRNLPSLNSNQGKQAMGVMGFLLLGDIGTNAIPDLVEIARNAASSSGEAAQYILMQLYPAKAVAVPYWLEAKDCSAWYYRAGEIQVEQKKLSNAVLAFSRAIDLNPTNAEVFAMRGGANLQLGDYGNAQADFDRALLLSPSNEVAVLNRGLCKYAVKNFKGALEDFNQVIRWDTNGSTAFVYRAIIELSSRDLNSALNDANIAIKLGTEDSLAYRTRATAESLQKNYEIALEDVTKAIEMNSQDGESYALRGRIDSALKNYREAIRDFDKAIALNPEGVNSYCSRAFAAISLDDFNAAEADLKRVFELNPQSPMGYITRGLLKVKRDGDDAGALADVNRANELTQGIPEILGFLGLVQYKAHRREEALANCREALQKGSLSNTSDLNAYVWLIQAQSGKESAANEELRAYLNKLASSNTNEWSTTTARFLIGQLSETDFLHLAGTVAKRAVDIPCQVCESFYYVAMKHKLAGDTAGAAAGFQKCLDTKYDNSFAYLNAADELRALKR